MSELKKYECTVLIDASCGVTVEASSPEEAAELAENAAAEQGAGSLCHQCSDHTECGDSYAVIVYSEDGDEVLDTDYRSGQLKAAQSELAALREELANLRLQCGGMEMDIDELKQRLADAEQRNATLIDALTEERRIRLLGQQPDIHWESLRDDRRACYAKTDAALTQPEEAKS